METNHEGQDKATSKKQGGAQNAESKPIGIENEAHNVIGGTSGDSPTNEQPSASQNNQWQQDNGSGPLNQPGKSEFHQNERNSKPAAEFTSSEDDELQSEAETSRQNVKIVEQNELEHKDQDFRDGENSSAENQDDTDDLRNGK
ncbi:hypothetical protein [Daejeonella lutea]|uniref:Uncharacterized protein n=1 Tax=Daejeonella lutea TaxID=572036 RepID=A0A1T5A935_9SPHI|nr:hypothetical protein [Daejeonella lutea]SKB31359.1 hypothetical protein SAMN05661099_0454 [Daejeonella lutea]